MIYEHLAPNMREADFCAKCFIDKNSGNVEKVRKLSFVKVKLMNGDEHHFMNCDVYRKWSMGRTYNLDGILYHSGFPQAKGGEMAL